MLHWRRALQRPTIQIAILLLLSCAAAFAIFLYIYGIYPLAASNLSWIYASPDSLQHFLGWQFFRNQPWTFPLGMIPSLGYPFGTSLTYTDSIPLVAILLKLINPLVQTRFQYLGIWTLFSFIAQFFLAVLILREFTKNWLILLLGAALVTLSPPLLYRTFYHTSLTSQWLILLAIFLVVRSRRANVPVWAWCVNVLLAVTVHPYFIPMVLGFFVVALAESYERERRLGKALRDFLIVGAATLIGAYGIGIFTVGGDDLLSTGFGTYSVNLNTLVNPFNTSRLLQGLPVFNQHQMEGYNYLGLGNLILLGLALSSTIWFGVKREFFKRNQYLFTAGLVFGLVSIAGTVAFNDHILLQVTVPDFLMGLAGTFRANGRFFWPVFYLLVLFSLLKVIEKIRFAPVLIAAALVLQLVDLQPILGGKHFKPYSVYTSPLRSALWDAAPQSTRHIMILPAERQNNSYGPFAIYASNHGMTLNWGYFARGKYNEIRDYGQQEIQNLSAGKGSADTVYVFCQMDTAAKIAASPVNPLNFYHTDNYYLGVLKNGPLDQPGAPWKDDLLGSDQILSLTFKNYLSNSPSTRIFFLTGKGAPFEGLDQATLNLLRSYGLSANLDPASTNSYIAVFGSPLGGKGLEISSAEPIEVDLKYRQVLNQFHLPFHLWLRSAGSTAGNYASMMIDGKEFAYNKAGINLLTYDVQSQEVNSLAFTRAYRVVCP